jgi:hypothetical protein
VAHRAGLGPRPGVSGGAVGYAAAVIVVCADLAASDRAEPPGVAIAKRCAVAGAPVQVVGIVPEGPDGDRQVLGLAAVDVGHAAVLRSPARSLEPADVDLALRYLPDIRVVVAVELEAPLLRVIASAAAFAGAPLVVIDGATGDRGSGADEMADAIVLQAPREDPDGTFAGFVGAFAAHLDRREKPADAWQATLTELAVDAVTPAPGRGPASAR